MINHQWKIVDNIIIMLKEYNRLTEKISAHLALKTLKKCKQKSSGVLKSIDRHNLPK